MSTDMESIKQIVRDEIQKLRVDSNLPAGFENSAFIDLDLDSLTTIELIVACMKKASIKIPREHYRHIKTPTDLANALQKFR